MKLSEKIVMLRKQNNLSQEALAEKMNVSRQAVSRWEVGTALPDAANILQLSKLFKVSTDYLLNEDYNSDKDIPIVKQQKDFILLIGLQVIAFVFHIFSCFYLAAFIVFPIISLILNLIITKQLKKELEKQKNISEKIYKIYITVYITITLLMLIFPMLSIFGMLFYLGF